ncbi:protein NO VEIN domain-containing protein [Streptomyces sp. NPDC096354]|uniref:protein NO VEIN domain-containing protein n=1 Tax=Streptomyces sp. NPDC096354 TaxID=3366088 RepID=UPI00381A05BD
MPVPPSPVLRAAVRWLERLPVSSTARCRALFTNHADFSDLTPTQYEAAYSWLIENSLLEDLHSSAAVSERVFRTALASSGAPWLPDADVLVRSPEELPEDALRAAEALGIPESEAYEQVSAVWGKVNTEARALIGSAGELALVNLIAEVTEARVEHVAAYSDGFGYDIAVHAQRHPLHVEAKSTVRRGRITFYLSRHEYETMRRDPAWQLVAVQLTQDLDIAAVASVAAEWISAQVPQDRGSFGRWEACRLDVSPDALVPGIPRLAPLLNAGTTGLLLPGAQNG